MVELSSRRCLRWRRVYISGVSTELWGSATHQPSALSLPVHQLGKFSPEPMRVARPAGGRKAPIQNGKSRREVRGTVTRDGQGPANEILGTRQILLDLVFDRRLRIG